MSIHQGHSHDRTLEPCSQEFMLAGWHVRPTHHCVTDGLETRQLEPRLMTLLCLLASRPGDVLSRDDLIESLWPRVVVNENSLTRAVSDLRRMLRDGRGTGFIETVPKQGYKLTAPVTDPNADCTGNRSPAVVTEEPADRERADTAGVAQWLQRHATTLAAINVTLAIAFIGSLGPFTLSPDRDISEIQPPSVARLALDDPEEPAASETPRGERGDIILDDDTRQYIPAVATSSMDHPASIGNSAGPAVSPDGELVAFTRRTDKGSTLLIGSMMDSSDPLQVYSSQHRIDHLRWSPVGTALLFSVLPTVSHAAIGEQEEGRLMLFDLQDLSVRELYRSGHDPDDTPARFNDALNIT